MIKSSVSSTRRSQSGRIIRAAVMSTPAVIAALSLTPAANAADLFWDVNGTTAGGASTTTAAGTWNASNTLWNTAADGTASTGTWAGAGNVAVFAAGTNVTGTYTVTVSGTQALDGVRFEEGTVTLSGGALNFAATQGGLNTTTAANVVDTISAPINGTGGLLRTGTDNSIVTLSGSNTGLSGAVQINSGILRISNANALGTGTGAVTDVVFGTAPDSNSAALQNARLDLSGGIKVTGHGITIRSGGSRTAQGQLNSSSGTNTWTGDILINGKINNEGTGLASLGAASGATLVIEGSTISNPAGSSTTGPNGVWWTKTGAGTLVLRNTSTQTVGSIRNINGILIAQSDGAFGPSVTGADNTPTGITDINQSVINAALSGNTPTVAFQNAPGSPGYDYTSRRFIRTAGHAGTGGLGEVRNMGGANSFAGDINFNLGTVLGVDAGSSLETYGGIWGAATTARTMRKVGTGEWIISGTNDGTNGNVSGPNNGGNAQFGITAGTFTVAEGTLTFRNHPSTGGLGSLSGGIGFVVNLGATLQLDNSLGVNTNRIGATAPITLSAGELKLIGNSSASVNQGAGALSVASFSTISVNQPANTSGATTTLSLGTLSRSNRGTALLRGMDNTTSFVGLSGTLKGGGGPAGNPSISILTEVVGDNSPTGIGSDFVTIDGGFARTLTASEYTPLVSGNTSVVNTTVTANTNVTTDTTVNSIKMSGGNTLAISPSKTLLVQSGGILGVGAGTSTISGGNLTFQDATLFSDPDTGQTSLIVNSVNEGIITVPTGSTLSVSSAIAGTEGVTKSGQGLLILSGTNTFGTDNDAVKGVTINAGTLQFSVDANLGSAAAPVILNGGTLNPTSTSTSSRNITLGSPGQNTIDVGTGGSFTVTGIVGGLGLTKVGNGTLALTNTSNSYTGGTTIQAGDMVLDPVNATQTIFGTGGITLAGGSITVPAATSMTLDKSLVSTSTNTTGGFNIPAGSTLTYGSGPASIVGMTGSGNYAINGGGTLILSHNNGAQMAYTGRLIVNDASTLVFENNGGTNDIAGIGGTAVDATQWVILNNGSTLRFNISSTAGSNFGGSGRGITIGGTGGTVEMTGTNILNTFGLITGPSTATFTKAGTGLLSLRANSGTSMAGKWHVTGGTLEFGNNGGNNGVALGSNTAADAITLDNGTTLQMTTSSSTGTTVGGITLNAGAETIAAKTATVWTSNGSVTGAGNLTVNSATLTGTVALNGAANNYTGSTTVAGGKLQLLSNVVGTSSVSVATGATVQLTSSGPGAFQRVLKTGSVGTAGTGKINIDNNKLVLTAQAVGSWNGSAYSDVSGLIASGYGVNQDFTGTTGIVTTQSNATGGNTLTSIGVASNTDLGLTTFGGVSVGANDTLAMYTYGGDANLDGIINGDDYFQIDSATASSHGWFNGDFNYDGIINGDDYFLIDQNFAAQGAAIPTSSGIGGGGLAGVTAVPEPASIALVGLGALSLLTRRSRRKS